MKIKRAEQHISELEAAIQAFFDANPPRFSHEHYSDPSEIAFFLEIDNPLPDPMLGAIAGDAIHNLHCALDHLWMHAVHRGRITKGSRRDHFRMYGSVTDFNDALRKTLPDNLKVPMSVIKEIEPHPSGRGKLLWFLRKLDDENKHEILTPVVHSAAMTAVYGPNMGVMLGRPLPSVTMTFGVGKQITEKRTELHRMKFPLPPAMKVHPEPLVICFGETPALQNIPAALNTRPIAFALRILLKETQRVVALFADKGLIVSLLHGAFLGVSSILLP